ncbi:hypothetical protein GO755_33430 [Spirosoma sp. HMF4905]|uniref:Uncharacterized protein n=1 Tax=Spirosoma arboris TaxID=2682092 RepID=A0A7K1SMH3_9BACT|nr:hypothetical protein [Spirosoma arboris]MVM34978.1 hypothetical protein [Spirosoma arboris]
MKTYTKLLCIAGLALILAFRPWRQVNQSVGLRSVSDSLDVALKESDSLLVNQAALPVETPVKVVLPTEEISALVDNVKELESEKKALLDKKKSLANEIAQLRKSVSLKQETIVSLKEIDELLSKQNKKSTTTGYSADGESKANQP